MRAKILERKLSDGSETYRVRVTYDEDFDLDFEMEDYTAALNFAAMFANGAVIDCDIFRVSVKKHAGLKPI